MPRGASVPLLADPRQVHHDPIAPEPRRFSICLPRPLWIGVAALALLLVAAGLRLGVPVYRQQAAIAKIEILGGQVERHPFGPSWLRKWVDEGRVERFDAVHLVNLADTATHDTDLACLTRSSVSDEGLLVIRTIPRLKCLILDETAITDDGMAHLGAARSLEALYIARTRITDHGLTYLRGLTGLRTLFVDGTAITDAGLRELSSLKSLKHLSVRETRISDTAVAALQRELPNLLILKYSNN